MSSFNYITKEGDRIDNLANYFYGGTHGISIISEANPDVPIVAVYDIGTNLIIPIIDDEDENIPTNLPPWKQ